MTAGSFPLGSSALSGGGAPPPPPPPPPPGLLPAADLGPDKVEIAFSAPVPSRSINRRALGLPAGVYLGFEPHAVGETVELRPDPEIGVSVAWVLSATDPAGLTIITDKVVVLDFTGHDTFPCYVIARTDYSEKGVSIGRIFTRATPATGPYEVQIAKVEKPAGSLVVSADAPANRHPPLALVDQAVGFLAGNAVGDLAVAAGTAAEVAAARTDLLAVPHSTLNDRIAADMAAGPMADRLGLRLLRLLSNDITIPAGASQVNVSPSFAALSRARAPAADLPPGGSETSVGVETGVPRNTCPLFSASTGRSLESAAGEPIFGRLTGGDTTIVGAALFSLAQTLVTGSGTQFATDIEPGDLLLGPDGQFYPVASVQTNTSLTLQIAYQSADAAAGPLTRRRFTLDLVTRASGAELPTTTAQQETARFLFAAWDRLDQAGTDHLGEFLARAGRPPVPDATATTPGKILLADDGALAGGLRRVRDNGVVIGNNPYALNFPVAGSVTDLGGGKCAVSVPGETGPQGDPGPTGPEGPKGQPGKGLTARNFRVMSGLSGSPPTAGSSITLTYTVDFSTAPTPMIRVDHLTGGLGYFKFISEFMALQIDYIAITDFGGNQTTGEIRGHLILDPGFPTSNSEFKLFLGAFGA